MAYTYMVQCNDGTYYTGWTEDLERRVAAHNAGRGARYTRLRRPVRLVYYEFCADRSAAMRREAAIKRLSHREKARLAEEFGATGSQPGGV